MPTYKLIIDTNLWISLLIGKRLSELRLLCDNQRISVYIGTRWHTFAQKSAIRVADTRKWTSHEDMKKRVNKKQQTIFMPAV